MSTGRAGALSQQQVRCSFCELPPRVSWIRAPRDNFDRRCESRLLTAGRREGAATRRSAGCHFLGMAPRR